ncbi:MAG: Gfo/Idh/MocA family oxidoreductase [Anaerolineae bacterium]|nr:Gfo/Idh/MocA family oxidoreductase [Anaerolineae bacterium]
MTLARRIVRSGVRRFRTLTGLKEKPKKRILSERKYLAPEPQGTPIRVAVLGAGRVSDFHLSVLNAFEAVKIVGLANRGNSDITAMGESYHVEKVFSNWRKMIEDTAPDAVLILVSHFETVPVTAAVLEMGIPCLIEKPAGFSSRQTSYLADLAAKHSCLNMVAVNRRYYSVVDYALDAIYQNGPLVGALVEAHEPIAKMRKNSRHSQALLDRWLVANSIHPIDLLRCVGGDVSNIHVLRQAWSGMPDSFSASMQLQHNALGTYVAHWSSVQGWSLQLYGNDIKVILNPLEEGEIIYSDGRRSLVPVDEVDLKFKPGIYAQNAAFLHAVSTGEALLPPCSDLADHVKTLQLIEDIAGTIHED